MEKTPQAQNPLERALEEAFSSDEVPRLYANGFINTITQADVTILLQRNGSPAAILNLSYTTAKTLAEKLKATIEGFEKTTGQTILTTDAVTQALSKSSEEQ